MAVGVWTSPDTPTGVTVVLPPAGTLGAIAIRGASPGTRESYALGPQGKLTVCHGVVLAGGSAFGLSAADGVVRWLAEHDIGYDVSVAKVPIVGAAICLDQSIAFPGKRPDSASGYAACELASTEDPVGEGSVGAGTGTTVAKVGGLQNAWRGGQGVAIRTHGDLVVGVVVINNAVGEVLGEDGSVLIGTRAPAGAPRFPYVEKLPPPPRGTWPPESGPPPSSPVSPGAPGTDGGYASNTVIGVIVTNARLDKQAAHRVADLGHTGVARALEPAHTQADGDALFCLATQRVDAHIDLVAMLAASAVAEAARRGPLAARSIHGIPAVGDARP